MFQAETEDMLPRMAPKPSASIPMGANEATVRPQVPEVSILFGQQEANSQQQLNAQMHQQQQNNTQQTYAAWKKQMLPKVSYPNAAMTQETYTAENGNNNNINIQNYNMPKTNLYPMRSANLQAPLTMPMGGQPNGFNGTSGGTTNPLTYRRSLESCNNVYPQIHQPYQQPQQQSSPRQILPITPTTQATTNSSRDVLTICAGTQTDEISESSNMAQGITDMPWSKLASKQDLNDILQLVQDMRHEQMRMAKMLESLIYSSQMATKPESRDISVQVDLVEKDNHSVVNGGCLIPELGQQAVVTNKFIQHLKPSTNLLQTPKGKPIAQSTTYRPNSPQTQRLQDNGSAANYRQPLNMSPSLPKSSSDTSIAMNELALKYLPNEKLVELLNELNMDCPQPPTIQQNHLPSNPSLALKNNPTTPNRVNKENFERAPTDISNASYKYLKKYRLLPEDHEDGRDVGNSVENGNDIYHNTPQYNTPHRQQCQQQYDVRNSPKCSPYAGRLPLSPLARGATPPSTPQHLVDLENIKHQPKFI